MGKEKKYLSIFFPPFYGMPGRVHWCKCVQVCARLSVTRTLKDTKVIKITKSIPQDQLAMSHDS